MSTVTSGPRTRRRAARLTPTRLYRVPPPLDVPPSAPARLVVLASTSKTFNVAGMHCGNVIIADEALRKRLAFRLEQLAISPNAMSMHMTPALYSPEGAAWVDGLNRYLDANHRTFLNGVDGIPGLKMQPMQGTYRAWVDFSGTGMTADEIAARVSKDAKIAASPGPSFGTGGESCLRFNIALPHARIEDAVGRLRRAFADLQ